MRTAWLTLVFAAALGTGSVGAAPREPQVSPDRKTQAAEVNRRIASEYSYLEALYRHFHSHPELSLQEEQTAARLARELKQTGLTVTEKVGGHGVVGVLKNGPGPTVMLRAELDALPVVEQTGLPYASKVKARDPEGKEVGVMHACAHDMHLACLVGAARVLSGMKDRWQGTLVFIGQPAEEIGRGARMMLAEGLFSRFPRPDYCLALHCWRGTHGSVYYREGPVMANSDRVEITVRGKGGHGAAPHTTVDPIVLAARIVLDLQTLISRENPPTDPAVITVGSIHGGTKNNIIPNEVHLQLTVRSFTDPVRKHLLEGIERVAKAAALGVRAPEPIVTIARDDYTPVTVNEPNLTRRMTALFRDVLGEARVVENPTVITASEDFGRYGREGVPSFLYFLGSYSPERVAEAEREGGRPLPSNHSDQYYPTLEPTLKTGVLTMSMAALNLLAGQPARRTSRASASRR